MPTLHARIVEALEKAGKPYRVVGSLSATAIAWWRAGLLARKAIPTAEQWQMAVEGVSQPEKFLREAPPPPTCTYCSSPASRISPNTRGGISVPVCDACWRSYKWPHEPVVVRLVDSDYVLPDDPTWAGTRRRP